MYVPRCRGIDAVQSGRLWWRGSRHSIRLRPTPIQTPHRSYTLLLRGQHASMRGCRLGSILSRSMSAGHRSSCGQCIVLERFQLRIWSQWQHDMRSRCPCPKWDAPSTLRRRAFASVRSVRKMLHAIKIACHDDQRMPGASRFVRDCDTAPPAARHCVQRHRPARCFP